MTDYIKMAKRFAESEHRSQPFMKTKLFYPAYLASVVQELRSFTNDPHILAAGWLSDTIKHNHATKGGIHLKFGKNIANLVDGVTVLSRGDPHSMGDAQTILCAQIITTVQLLSKHNPPAVGRYCRLVWPLLEITTDAQPDLLVTARKAVGAYVI